MLQFVPRQVHGGVDYAYALAAAAAPFALGFAADPAPAVAAWLLAGGVAAAAAFTRYEWGVVRVLPFRLHLLGDAAFGLLALQPEGAARAMFLAAGAFSVAAALVTRREEMPAAA